MDNTENLNISTEMLLKEKLSTQRKIVQMGALQKLQIKIIDLRPVYPIHTNSLF